MRTAQRWTKVYIQHAHDVSSNASHAYHAVSHEHDGTGTSVAMKTT